MYLTFFLSVLLVVFSACAARGPVADRHGNSSGEGAGPHGSPATPGDLPFPDTPEHRAQAEAQYSTLEQKVRAKPDFDGVKRLRELYVRTDRYQPYGADGFAPDQMFKAMDEKRWEDCLTEASSRLARNYVDMNSHLGAMVCNREAGHPTEAAHHEAMLKHVFDIIDASGDGKSEETAFTTYWTPELYAFLGLYGLQNESQALSESDGKYFDVMHVKERKTGKEHSVYFDITWQFVSDALKEGAVAPQ